MIEFQNMEKKYIAEAVHLAMAEYEQECYANVQLMKKNFRIILEEKLTYLFQQKYGKLAVKDGKLIGYLIFEGPWDGFFGLVKGVFSPLGGSAFGGDDRGKLASMLFEKVGNMLAADGICSYAISRYVHDTEVGSSFVMNGFGIRCSDAIMRLGDHKCVKISSDEYEFCELPQSKKWQIDLLRRGLTRHLCTAPIFFPTDLDQYNAWFNREEVRVFVAKRDEKVIGFLSIDAEAETFVTEEPNISNICGAYVDPEYRGTGVADMLLEYLCEVCEKDGMEYLGVDYETLNPTALRFWRKYFTNYTYSYARRIDERVVGYSDYLNSKRDIEKN